MTPALLTDAAALLAAILKRPADDGLRLVYADWLDENAGTPICKRCDGQGFTIDTSPYGYGRSREKCEACGGTGHYSNGNAERAEFIRVQVELARLGQPHVVVTEPCVLTRRYGPGYFTLTGGELTDHGPLINLIKVGSRVDVLKPRGKKPAYGLRVHRIGSFNDPGGDSEVVVVRDGESRPWPGDALRRREQELLQKNARDWFSIPGLLACSVWDHSPTIRWFRPVDSRGESYIVGGDSSKGFLAHVAAPLDVLIGETCGRCEGFGTTRLTLSGRVRGAHPMVPAPTERCERCHGTGRIPGVLAALLEREPVTSVRAVDCEPWAITAGKAGFRWFCDDIPDAFRSLGRLSTALVRLMPEHPDYAEEDVIPTLFRSYPTPDAANAALSDALIAASKRRD